MAIARGERRIAIRSGHGVGKTTTLAWAIVWWICTRFPQKTVCTAPTQDQLFDALAAETKTWLAKLPAALRERFEILAESIFLKPTPEMPQAHEMSFVSFRTSRPDKPEAMAGIHAENVLLIGDEASGIPEEVYEAAVGSMSGESAVTLLAGNPTRGNGYFYDCFHDNSAYWFKVLISCVGHPRITKDFIDQVRNTYGENSNAFRVRVLGEFPLADDDTIIPAHLIEAALDRPGIIPSNVKEIWGLDVARFGSDSSALARRKGNVLLSVEEKRGYDTMQLTGWVVSQYNALKPQDQPSEILVDVIGIGAGVVDRLRELGLPVRGINVSETPTIFDERYLNHRAELWFKGREWFESKDCSLRGDKDTAKELKMQTYGYSSNGKIKATPKSELPHSPNRADAFLLTLDGESVSALGGKSWRSNWKKPLGRTIKGLV
jgi:hypothetical protein